MRLFLKNKTKHGHISVELRMKNDRVANLFIKWHRNFSSHEFIHINERRYSIYTHKLIILGNKSISDVYVLVTRVYYKIILFTSGMRFKSFYLSHSIRHARNYRS